MSNCQHPALRHLPLTLLNEYKEEFLQGVKFGLAFQENHEKINEKLLELEQKCDKLALKAKASRVKKLAYKHNRLFVDLEWMIYTRGLDQGSGENSIDQVKKRANDFAEQMKKTRQQFFRLNKIVSNKRPRRWLKL